jgi:CheY-like chemotaxis protein
MTKPLHVLVVEDSTIAQMVIRSQMNNQGCTVDIAVDGNSAIEQANKTIYAAILMDIGLGNGPDGFDVTTQIKKECELNKTTPIIAVTSHIDPEYRQKSITCGMDGFLNKPFTSEYAKTIVEYIKTKNPALLEKINKD